MMLYIVRHAIAEDAPQGGDDAARRLTPDGRRKMAEVARGLRALRVAPDVVLTSPLVREV
jgi:phosphohistidine phosphatase